MRPVIGKCPICDSELSGGLLTLSGVRHAADICTMGSSAGTLQRLSRDQVQVRGSAGEPGS